MGNDFSEGKGAKATANWTVQNLDSGRWTHPLAEAFADGIGFAFGTTQSTRFFLTKHQGSGLLGDLTGKTLTATFTITGTATAFTHIPGYVPGDGSDADKNHACPTPESVRLYFEDNTKGP